MTFADFALKLVAMATSLKQSVKEGKTYKLWKYPQLGKNFTKIGPVNPNIIGF